MKWVCIEWSASLKWTVEYDFSQFLTFKLTKNAFQKGRRHTTFAAVQVFPYEETEISSRAKDFEIPTRDLKVETMKSQGAGGQSVNKTESAIRITHLPTGISAFVSLLYWNFSLLMKEKCQLERSQHRNRATAMFMLRAKLLAKEEEEKEREKNDAHSSLPDNSWGNQIRNYVLQPYQLVKDVRTGYESSNVLAVMDGDIDE